MDERNRRLSTKRSRLEHSSIWENEMKIQFGQHTGAILREESSRVKTHELQSSRTKRRRDRVSPLIFSFPTSLLQTNSQEQVIVDAIL